MTFALWLAALDALVHLLVLGYALTQMESHVDSSVATIRCALFGDVLGHKESCSRDVLTGGEAKKASHMFTTVEALHIADFTD